MITLITLTQGNPIALKRTVDNVLEKFQGKVNEVIIGDLCVFEQDREVITNQFYFPNRSGVQAIGVLPLGFNMLFHEGFGRTLNILATSAHNDLCLYMNVSEIVDSPVNLDIIHPQWNSYKFDHATETHKWCRLWNRKQLKWSGRIHEIVVEGAGQKYTSPDILFTMADTPKDDADPFYSAVMNDIKEMVYFKQYLTLVDSPQEIAGTDQGWVKYARDSYQHIKDRLLAKGARYEAFVEGDLQKYLDNCKEFEPQQNSDLIHFQ